MLFHWKNRIKNGIQFSLKDTLLTVGILVATTALSFALQVFDQYSDYASMLFVLAVFLISRVTEGYFYGIASSLGSVLLVNFLFTYPNFKFNFTLAGYPIAILCMLAVSVTTSTLTSRAKYLAQTQIEVEREKTRSNLLRAISHDLRTPLTGILGASSAILENDDHLTKEERLSLLQDVNADAQWLIRMVENLLTITRMDDANGAKVVKSPEAAEEILEAAAAKFKKQFPNWKVSLQVPDEFLMIPMDAVLIEQVLFNLMENAVNHAIGADQIWVSLERYSEDGIFAVRDNGCGIDPALLPGIFDGKTSTPESMGDRKRNMGIGLSVCHTIIRAHGGSMKAENEKTGGAVFSFTLPLEEGVYE